MADREHRVDQLAGAGVSVKASSIDRDHADDKPKAPRFPWWQLVLVAIVGILGGFWLAYGLPGGQLLPGVLFGAGAGIIISLLASWPTTRQIYNVAARQWDNYQSLLAQYDDMRERLTSGFEQQGERALRERLTNGKDHDGIQLMGHHRLPAANFTGHSFRRAVFDFDTVWKGSDLILDNAVFSRATMDGMILYPLSATRTDFTDTQLYEARLSGIYQHGNFQRARLANALFGTEGRLVLDDTDFSDANLARTAFLTGSLDRANFSFCVLNQAVFAKLELSDVKLCFAYLLEANFSDTVWMGADFTGALLASWGGTEPANLKNVEIRMPVNMTGAWLCGADLSGVRGLTFANLNGAFGAASTKWPEGFDWRAAGVRYIKSGEDFHEASDAYKKAREAARREAHIDVVGPSGP
jgi:uncharacterized protein YjbI with pentapeptide repeats